ncbi:MAG: hypothetical protein COC01_05280 [Bacteroidetes bacterium]|nr:MAG: hypothetical protein COC01_05280 [Bacteroidota bacterium]
MDKQIIDISKFKESNDFYDSFTLITTVKSFDLQEIRKRYVASRKTNKSGKVGSVERREVGVGGIVKVNIDQGKVTSTDILAKFKEPRGIGICNDYLGIAAENTVFLISDNAIKEINNPWFSYIHTIDFSPHESNKVLISSSGLDCIFEYDTENLSETFSWFAWENGFNEAIDPKSEEKIILTRDALTAEDLKNSHQNVILIENPTEQVLPTAMRAAFINSVVYDSESPANILGTFFHKGAVYKINMNDKQANSALEELKSPHGGFRLNNDIMATSTATGEVVIGDSDNQERFTFENLPGKPDYLDGLEWLQNSKLIGDNIITIDSNRTSFVIFNIKTEVYSMVPYDNNWAIQDMIIGEISARQENHVRSLSSE